MGKPKKELLASAPWRTGGDDQRGKFKDAKLKVTAQPGSTPTMHVPGKNKSKDLPAEQDDSLTEIDPELRYSFQRNFQVKSCLHFLDFMFIFYSCVLSSSCVHLFVFVLMFVEIL